MYPRNNDLTKITDGQNKIDTIINFTYELETKKTWPFLNILQIDNNKLWF